MDGETTKVGPTVVEVAKPVLNDPIDSRTEVQLMAECVDLSMEVNTLGRQSCNVDVECMRSFVRWHVLINDRIKIDGGTTNGDRHERMWSEWSAGACGRVRVAHDGEESRVMVVKRLILEANPR